MTSSEKRPWYRFYWLTCLVILPVAASLLFRQFEPRLHLPTTHYGPYTDYTRYGWPRDGLLVIETGDVRSKTKPTFDLRWAWFEVAFNAVFCLSLAAASAIVIERWRRNHRTAQFSLSALFSLVIVVSVLIWVLNGKPDRLLRQLRFDLLVTHWKDLQHPTTLPILLAGGFTLYYLGWLGWHATARLHALCHRISRRNKISAPIDT